MTIEKRTVDKGDLRRALLGVQIELGKAFEAVNEENFAACWRSCQSICSHASEAERLSWLPK